MKVFITGASGYIGHQLALAAAERGYAVAALVRSLRSPLLPHHPNIQFFQGDITNADSIKNAIAGCEAVFHAAALTQFWHRNRSLFTQINVEGTRNVLEAAVKHGVKKFVFTSSCAVLGPSGEKPLTESDPRLTPFENDYEVSKFQAEELVKEYGAKGLHTVIVSPPRVYGPGLATKGNPIGKLVRDTVKRGIAFMPAADEVVGNYAFVGDVVAGHLLALDKGRNGEKYILGGENVSYRQLFETIALASGRKLKIVALPVAVLKMWAAAVSGIYFLLGRQTHLSIKVVERLVQNRALSTEKAVRELGYSITPFRRGMEMTIAQLKNEL